MNLKMLKEKNSYNYLRDSVSRRLSVYRDAGDALGNKMKSPGRDIYVAAQTPSRNHPDQSRNNTARPRPWARPGRRLQGPRNDLPGGQATGPARGRAAAAEIVGTR